MKDSLKIAVIIPVLNEADTIQTVLDTIPKWVDVVFVADNGCTDNTTQLAKERGAVVVREPRRGYGAACLKAMETLSRELAGEGENPTNVVVVFLDGDFSDDPTQMAQLVTPITTNQKDFVLGSRVLGPCEAGALTTSQRFGNWLSCALLKLLFGGDYTDLGPFRAIRYDKLLQLKMDDLDFGWTVQMQARASRQQLRIAEVPVNYRNRAGGTSKVSGTIKGVYGAGTTILKVIFKEALITDHLDSTVCCRKTIHKTIGLAKWILT